jgi:hypothetical protein
MQQRPELSGTAQAGVDSFRLPPGDGHRGTGRQAGRATCWTAGLVQDAGRLCMRWSQPQLAGLERMAEKSAENLEFKPSDASRGRDLARFIFALGIRNVGEQTAKDLARRFGRLDALMAAASTDALLASARCRPGGRGLHPAPFFAETHNQAVIAATCGGQVPGRMETRRSMCGRQAGRQDLCPDRHPADADARTGQGHDRSRGRQGGRQRLQEDRLFWWPVHGGRQQAGQGAGTGHRNAWTKTAFLTALLAAAPDASTS